jgi:hypothetical protein
MTVRRIIESALGHKIALEILPGNDVLCISRPDVPLAGHALLDERACRILSAYLAGALVVDRQSRPPEEIGDVLDTVLTMKEYPAPYIRLQQGEGCIDIHSPCWDALRCEIDLILPRFGRSEGCSIENRTRH